MRCGSFVVSELRSRVFTKFAGVWLGIKRDHKNATMERLSTAPDAIPSVKISYLEMFAYTLIALGGTPRTSSFLISSKGRSQESASNSPSMPELWQ